MNSFFLRIYLSALAFLLATFFLIMYVANALIYDKLLIDSSATMQQTIVQALSTKPPSAWQSEVQTYNALITEYTLSLVSLESLSEKEKQQLLSIKDSGQSLLSENKLGRADLYTLSKLPNSDRILKINEDDSYATPLNEWVDTVIFFILLIVPLAFALYFLIRKLTTPIQHLTLVADRLRKGDWSARANEGLAPPMNTLAKGFNAMAEQLNNTLQEQQVLIGAIPHELRSPLGKIRFALDMTRQSKTTEVLRKDIESIDGYVDEMQITVDEILELNKLQNQTSIALSPVNLCELLNTVTEPHLKETSLIDLSVDCEQPTKVTAHAALLKLAIQNLVQNAKHYADSVIRINAWKEEGQITIRVDDDGTGIPEDKRDLIFTPFTTLDSSRNRGTGGIGLGLAIVKLVMDKHDGDVSVSNNSMGGARFELRWSSNEFCKGDSHNEH